MEEKEFRLECLRFAANLEATPEEVVERAKQYHDFVSGFVSSRATTTANDDNKKPLGGRH